MSRLMITIIELIFCHFPSELMITIKKEQFWKAMGQKELEAFLGSCGKGPAYSICDFVVCLCPVRHSNGSHSNDDVPYLATGQQQQHMAPLGFVHSFVSVGVVVFVIVMLRYLFGVDVDIPWSKSLLSVVFMFFFSFSDPCSKRFPYGPWRR